LDGLTHKTENVDGRQGKMSSSFAAPPGRQNLSLVIALISIPFAIFFGLISVTASPILASFAVALIAGFTLLAKPEWIVWIVLSLGLLITGMLPLYIHEGLAARGAWSVSILGFFLMFLAFFKMIISPDIQKNTPIFIWITFIFFVYAVLNALIQWHSTGEFLGGFKRYFQMWGLIFAFCWFAFDEQKIHRWRKFILLIALLQLPFAVQQLIVWAPLRESMKSAFPGMVPVDVVAGTFGSSITGGGASAEMAVFLVIILGFLLARRMEKTLSGTQFALFTSIVLMPLFLGETKAVLVMLPLMFLVLYRHKLFVRLRYWLLSFIAAILITLIAGYAYMSFMPEKTQEELIADAIDYNFKEKGYGNNYLNRTTVLTFWAEKQKISDPVSFAFGNGLGASHSATGGHIAIHYPGYGIGLTAASTLLWDLGIFGFSLFVSILFFAWRCANRLIRESNSPQVRADAVAIQAALAIFAFYLFYRIGTLELLSIQIVFAVLLGYLAWLHRSHASGESKQHT